MVLVAVGDEDGADTIFLVLQVGRVGEEQIDPEHFFLGEPEPHVDDDDVLAALEDGHVLADLADAPEENDAHPISSRIQACLPLKPQVACHYTPHPFASPQNIAPPRPPAGKRGSGRFAEIGTQQLAACPQHGPNDLSITERRGRGRRLRGQAHSEPGRA